MPQELQDGSQLICCKCDRAFEKAKVTARYLGGEFPIEMWRCPQCGVVFVPESLALGKMLQVEQALEDK